MNEEKYQDFLKSCAGKIKHKSLLAAQYFLDEYHTDELAEIYTCRCCHSFHIGSSGEILRKANHKARVDLQHKNKLKKFKM